MERSPTNLLEPDDIRAESVMPHIPGGGSQRGIWFRLFLGLSISCIGFGALSVFLIVSSAVEAENSKMMHLNLRYCLPLPGVVALIVMLSSHSVTCWSLWCPKCPLVAERDRVFQPCPWAKAVV